MTRSLRAAAVLALALVAVVVPAGANAAPPGNDNFVDAAAVDLAGLPWSTTLSNVEATTEPGEVQYCGAQNTVWYVITATSDAFVRVSPAGTSFYGAALTAYRQDGSGLGGLTELTCSNSSGSDLSFPVQAGSTYYVQAGSSWYGSGTLELTFSIVQPPANDDFANAATVGSLPFSDTQDTTAATTEDGEPLPSCSYAGRPVGSIWYRYTPVADGSVTATTSGSYPTTIFAAYTGSSLGSLAEVGCRTQYGRLTMAVKAGVSYTFLVGSLYGVTGQIAFQLDVAPSPVPQFGWSPYDPSTFDTVQFSSYSYDPADVGFNSYRWTFGDGASSTGSSPSHKYASDGQYNVSLSVTTYDGRQASVSSTVTVSTHDVSISKFTVPQSASSGQTRLLVVGLTNHRYPETIRIDLYRSTASGYVQFASSTQSVPVRSGNRTSDHAFNYTFTGDDAALGKITFRAVATILNARDALPADNEAISLPTKVTR